MIRVSFRKVMLAGFVLVILVLGGMAVRSWLVVEHFVAQSRHGGELAVQLTASIQEIGEGTVDVERSARQYLVLGDPIVRQRFDENLAQSILALDRLEALSIKPLAVALADWRTTAQGLKNGLDGGAQKEDLAPILAHLVQLNSDMKLAAQQWIEMQNGRVLDELENSRLRLGGQLIMALAGALIVALAMGWWLMWPMRHLERAITRLGEKRFDESVVIGGPADLRQLGRRLDWLRQRLAELEADRERMLRHVSHELKTPLTALREGVSLLQEEVPGTLEEAQKEVVEILQHNVIALQRQIESLLSLNSAAFDARQLQFAPVVLPELLDGVVRRRDLHIQARQLRLKVEASQVTVMADAEKLGVILDNLLSNAIDFSPEGGEIRLLARHEKGCLILECADRGTGVAPEDVERIFEPFVQGQRRAPTPRRGSGVGLSIVRELVRAMGGRVGLRPSGRGARFYVEIPDEK
ncbi:MAG: HAMP domain-containing protein [Rhodocyclales bacterium GT-UBC]|nr:MAG: HAMP domain-containing protein [Rhodocyclales bacterium GT-UBC]